MPKTKRLTFRLDADLDRTIVKKCESLGCTKSQYMEALVRSDDEFELPKEAQRVRGEPYDVYNEKTGGFDRFDRNGKNIAHFRPTEIINGTQYYRDTMGSDPNRKWIRDKQGTWIPVARVVIS